MVGRHFSLGCRRSVSLKAAHASGLLVFLCLFCQTVAAETGLPADAAPLGEQSDKAPVEPPKKESDADARARAEAARELYMSRIEAPQAERKQADPEELVRREAAEKALTEESASAPKKSAPKKPDAVPEQPAVEPRVSRIESPRPSFSF